MIVVRIELHSARTGRVSAVGGRPAMERRWTVSDDSARSWIDQRLEDPETRTAYQKEVTKRIAELEATLAGRDRRIAELEVDLEATRQLLADAPTVARAIETAGVNRYVEAAKRIAKLEEALGFYRDPENYQLQPSEQHKTNGKWVAMPVMVDAGKRARQALDATTPGRTGGRDA